MSQTVVGRFWCYQCNQVVNPDMEVELELKCPVCDGGFVEEMESRGDDDSAGSAASDRSLSLWAPILLEMLGGSSRGSRYRREENDNDDSDTDPGLDVFARRRRTAILQVLQSIRDEHRIDPDNTETQRERERERERRESVILINPFREAIILQGSSDSEQNQGGDDSDNSGLVMSFGDYFLGPGLDLLLQHLAENDPNRFGTPPAKKEVVDALPKVKIEEAMSCSVCLDDFAIGMEAKEMPCKHKFHHECILPWLELHSSCPVCRFQLPADESKIPNGSNDSTRVVSGGESGRDESNRHDGGDSTGFWFPAPWPFNGLLSLSGSENGGNSSTSSSNPQDNTHAED